MHKFLIGRTGDLGITPDLTERMFELRHLVFEQRLGWDVRSVDGLEFDEFDDESTIYVIGKNLITGRVEASWRLRPTTGTYMLRNVFPQLLHGNAAPVDEKVWEVSRFAVMTDAVSDPFGFKRLTQELVAQTVDFGIRSGIERFVWVCSAGVERLALNLGYQPRRLGPPIRIGSVVSVAAEIDLDVAAKNIAAQHWLSAELKVAA